MPAAIDFVPDEQATQESSASKVIDFQPIDFQPDESPDAKEQQLRESLGQPGYPVPASGEERSAQDFQRQQQAFPQHPRAMGTLEAMAAPINETMRGVGKVATEVLNAPVRLSNLVGGLKPGDKGYTAPLDSEKPLVQLPEFAKPNLPGTPGVLDADKTVGQKAVEVGAGVANKVSQLASGLSAPGTFLPAVMLPGGAAKALFGTQIAANIPATIQESAKTLRDPNATLMEKGGAVAAPLAEAWMLKQITKAAPVLPQAAKAAAEVIGNETIKKGVENASSQRETAPVHGTLPAQPVEGAEQVPIQEGSARVQPTEAEAKGQPPVRLTEPATDVAQVQSELGKAIEPKETTQIEPPTPTEAPPVETPETYAAKSKVLADKLRSAFKTETQGTLFTGPVHLINAAVEIAAKIIEGGGKLADAIDAAVKHLRANYQGKDYKSEVDEEAFSAKIRAAVGEEQAAAPVAASAGDAKGVYGVAERVRDERAKAGQVDQVSRGQGISAPDSVDIGRALKAQGADPESIMQAFETTQKLSSDDMAVVRAHGEDLARAARRIEEKSGTESPEYKAAYKTLSDWDRRSKVMQTEWHKTGMAQQGETDIDTGTFTGLQRAYEDATGKNLNPKQTDTAKQRARKVREAFAGADAAKQKWKKHVADEGDRTTTEKRAFDAANKTVREAATRMADAERKSGEIDAKRDADVRKIQEKSAERAQKAAQKTVQDAATRLAKAQAKSQGSKSVADRAAAKVQEDAAQRALDAANKTVRENAVREAKKETAERVRQAAAEKLAAEKERVTAKKALDEANKLMREAAIKTAKEETKNRVLAADPAELVRKKVGEYIEKGMDDPDDIRNKVATDLGISVADVHRALAKDKRTKFLTDDLWRKQQVARRLDQQAKRWVTQAAIPSYLRAIQSVPRILFSLKVGFHGTVALGTHAPMVAFQPKFWSTYVRDFGKMYRMVGNRAYYEMQVQDLLRRPNYTTARRAGLVNDPFQYEDFNSPDTSKYFGGLTGMGNRGYSVLKILRQDMFDQYWNALPKTAQIAEVAQAISDSVNHATGVVKVAAPKGAHLALFAPRLEASRVAWLAVDPAKALATFADWKHATDGEKHFAMSQLKEKAWVAGTMFGLLALNQGFLSATGSKQKINGLPQALGGRGFDPMESDFLKFKAAGMDVSYGNAMLSMARLPARLAAAIMYEGKMSKIVLEDERVAKIIFDYVRSQMSPFSGTATDLALGRDYAGRPLPRAGFGLLPGRKDIPKRLRQHGVTAPYSWPEYTSQQFTPIPISEGIREVWGHGGLGMTDKQIEQTLKAWGVTMIMMGTGGRISEDWHTKK